MAEDETTRNDSDEKLPLSKRKELLRAIAVASPEGEAARKSYIRTRAQKVIPFIAEESYARQIFVPDPLDPGEPAEYPIGPDQDRIAGWVSSGLGRTPRRVLETDMMSVPLFFVEEAVQFPMSVAQSGRVIIAEEKEDHLKNGIVKKENLIAFTLLAAVAGDGSFPAALRIEIGTPGNGNVDQATGEGFLSKQLINQMMIAVDNQRRRMTDLFVSPTSLGDIREWSEAQVDMTTRRQIWTEAGLASIWDITLHKVYGGDLLDNGTVYGIDKAQFGVMPVRSELETVEDPTAIADWNVGIQGRENIGMGVRDYKGLVLGTIDRP